MTSIACHQDLASSPANNLCAGLPAWHGSLQLDFAHQMDKTILARRQHNGPLLVQKVLYPEGPAVCHSIVVHPPGGIAGGDQLTLQVNCQPQAHALLSTPGAGKWYRSANKVARQTLHFELDQGAMLEWLPQENIFFDQSCVELDTKISLASTSGFIGFDITCLGRTASHEIYNQGQIRSKTEVCIDGELVWYEANRILGRSHPNSNLSTLSGLANHTVSATILCVKHGLNKQVNDAHLVACRSCPAENGIVGITMLPHVLLGRYLGHSSASARDWLLKIWEILRPALADRDAETPRIWRT